MTAKKASKKTADPVDDILKGVEDRIATSGIKAPEMTGEIEESSKVAKIETVVKDETVKTRVFRIVKPRKKEQANRGIVTLMTTKHIEAGTEVPAQFKKMLPNHANQYVLEAGAREYSKQLAVLRKFEAAGEIEEVPLSHRGVPFVSKEEQELAEIDKKRNALMRELGMSLEA